MSAPRFIQISTLTSYPAALLNRDDSGLAKRIPFGRATRTRVSSQCLKRHWRLADDPHNLAKAAPGLDLSTRSRALFRKRIFDPLVKEGVPAEVAEPVLLAFSKDLYEGKDKERTTEEGKSPLDRSEVVVLGEPEIAWLMDQARELCANADEDPKQAAKLAKEHLKKNKKEFNALKCGAGIDAAMFGRFVSGDPEARVAAAVHVAHSFTVHPESSETDYFTAVDDLLTRTEGGSGHLGAAELTSGLFYTYTVVDVPLLVSNLTGCQAEAWLNEERDVAGRVVNHLVHLMATVTPGAKLGSTAPYDWAGLVLAEAGDRQPRTLANAFLEPVELAVPDLFGRTVTALADYVEAMDAMYGPGEERWLACRLQDVAVPAATNVNLPELADALEQAIQRA
jgi:CRISPR system Cascade subunit CasC